VTTFSPNASAKGFLKVEPNPARYDNASSEPDDVAYKIAALLPKRARVLDIGCGTGAVSALVRKFSECDITAIEPDSERVALARRRGLKVIEGYLTENLAAKLGRFDAIVFADVLEHLANPADMITCASSLLVPGGFIVASVPNAAHWTLRLDLLRGRFEYEDCGIMDATHLRWFTHESARAFFERLGFDVVLIDQTIMVDLPAYGRRKPWKWTPRRVKLSILRLLVRYRPRVFGCQVIIQAKPKPRSNHSA
jgi:methionine biosynthesis protein MetW